VVVRLDAPQRGRHDLAARGRAVQQGGVKLRNRGFLHGESGLLADK